MTSLKRELATRPQGFRVNFVEVPETSFVMESRGEQSVRSEAATVSPRSCWEWGWGRGLEGGENVRGGGGRTEGSNEAREKKTQPDTGTTIEPHPCSSSLARLKR